MYRPEGFHLHHFSYRREHWTDVIALPSKLHARWHSFLRYVPEAMCFTDGVNLLDTREKHVESMVRHLRLPRE